MVAGTQPEEVAKIEFVRNLPACTDIYYETNVPSQIIGEFGTPGAGRDWISAQGTLAIRHIIKSCGPPPPETELQVQWQEHEVWAFRLRQIRVRIFAHCRDEHAVVLDRLPAQNVGRGLPTPHSGPALGSGGLPPSPRRRVPVGKNHVSTSRTNRLRAPRCHSSALYLMLAPSPLVAIRKGARKLYDFVRQLIQFFNSGFKLLYMRGHVEMLTQSLRRQPRW